MSSESDFDPSDRSEDSTGSEGDVEEPSDEEDEEECAEEDPACRIIFVGRGVEFPDPGDALVVEEDRPDGFHLDEYVFTNAVAYMMGLVHSGDLVVRRVEMMLFIEVTRTKTIFQLPIPPEETANIGGVSSGDIMNMAAVFREFILQGGGNLLADDGLIIWVSYAVPGKPSQRRMFMLSELSLEAMRARW